MVIKKIKEKKIAAQKARRKAHAVKVAKVAASSLALGALGGVLFAPKSGKDTRKHISNSIADTNQAITNKSKKIVGKTNDSIKNTKDKIDESKQKIKDYFDQKKNEVEVSIEECFDDITQNNLENDLDAQESEEKDEANFEEEELEEKSK